MFSECIHSLADTINQLILAYGIHKSIQVMIFAMIKIAIIIVLLQDSRFISSIRLFQHEICVLTDFRCGYFLCRYRSLDLSWRFRSDTSGTNGRIFLGKIRIIIILTYLL